MALILLLRFSFGIGICVVHIYLHCAETSLTPLHLKMPPSYSVHAATSHLHTPQVPLGGESHVDIASFLLLLFLLPSPLPFPPFSSSFSSFLFFLLLLLSPSYSRVYK